jgi:hypothetical protein
MNSQKIPNNYLENKIRSFQEGVDYRFEKEKYYAPGENNKGYTGRNYQILSPQLRKVVQDYLSQQNAILMQFAFENAKHRSSHYNRISLLSRNSSLSAQEEKSLMFSIFTASKLPRCLCARLAQRFLARPPSKRKDGSSNLSAGSSY